MASFRTIVGGRSSGPPESTPFPRGIELLLKKAKADPGFRAFFLEHPVSAARKLGLALGATEEKILGCMPAPALAHAVEHTHLHEEQAHLFRSARTAGALLAALSVVVALPPHAAAMGQVERPYVMQDADQVAVDRMMAIQRALEEYRTTRGEYPSTLQWVTEHNPLGGFLPRTGIFDPWYQRFRYEGIVSGGRVVNYRLQSPGPDLVSTDDDIACPIDAALHSFVVPNPVAITSPRSGDTIVLGGAAGGDRFWVEARYTGDGGEIVWLLDKLVVGTTRVEHRIPISAGIGAHEVVAQDAQGNSDVITFEVASRTGK